MGTEEAQIGYLFFYLALMCWAKVGHVHTFIKSTTNQNTSVLCAHKNRVSWPCCNLPAAWMPLSKLLIASHWATTHLATPIDVKPLWLRDEMSLTKTPLRNQLKLQRTSLQQRAKTQHLFIVNKADVEPNRRSGFRFREQQVDKIKIHQLGMESQSNFFSMWESFYQVNDWFPLHLFLSFSNQTFFFYCSPIWDICFHYTLFSLSSLMVWH